MADRATLPRPAATDGIVTTLNRMSCLWREVPTHAFLGLVPIGGDYTAWGVDVEGVDYCAVHLFQQDFPWGDDEYDTKETASKRPWVVMFLGEGSRSFYRRFVTEEEATTHFEGIDGVHFDDPGTFRYES